MKESCLPAERGHLVRSVNFLSILSLPEFSNIILKCYIPPIRVVLRMPRAAIHLLVSIGFSVTTQSVDSIPGKWASGQILREQTNHTVSRF